MGASSSKGDRDKVVCLNCDKKTQKEPPAAASTGNDCRESYDIVSKCMDQHKGQGECNLKPL